MAGTDVARLVAPSAEVGSLQQQVAPIDATVHETWPAGVNAGAEALGADAQRFGDKGAAREAATALAGSS